MNTAMFVGSFEPFTLVHLDIVQSSAKIFDKLIIAIAHNAQKTGFLPIDKRIELIQKSTHEFNNVEVVTFEGLTAQYAKEHNIKILVRGIRNSKDLEYENQIASANQALNPELATIFIPTKAEHNHISSSIVKEIYLNNGDITDFVPYPVQKYLESIYNAS